MEQDLVRVALDEQDYSTLVNGGVIQKQLEDLETGQQTTVQIILQDIGFARMQAHLAAAIAKVQKETS